MFHAPGLSVLIVLAALILMVGILASVIVKLARKVA